MGPAAATARNHEGSDTTYYADPGHLPLYADLLFTAPAAGSYTCGVWAWTASSASDTYRLTATAGGTWLEVSDTPQAGARWWENPVAHVSGNPVKIDGRQGTTQLTHGLAMNVTG